MALLSSVRCERVRLALHAFLLAMLVIGLSENRAPAGPLPRLAILDSDALIGIKKRLQTSDAALGPPLTKLKHDAEQALHLKPQSVTDKALLPPSGSKHDYMSIAPYWWPNPSTADGLPFVRRDGEVNPARDRRSDRRRLEKLIESVKSLALAYFFYAREDDAAHAAKLLRVWFLDPSTKMNPNLRYAQSVPGRNAGRGAGIIETHDLPELVDFVSLLAGSQAWRERERQQWRDWLEAYVSWLIESPEGKMEAKAQNNHGTWYDVQVAAFGAFTGQDELAKKTLGEFPAHRIDAQIQPDGRQDRELARTRSWDYAIFNLEALFNAASIADKLGFHLWHYRSSDGRSIRQALDWLVPFAVGDRKWSYRQIGLFRPEKLAPLLRRASVAYHEPAYELAISRLKALTGKERWELLFPKFAEVK